MTMRITGMYSGLDTESIIQELVKAKSVKVDNLKKEKTKMEWKQEAWSGLNTKIKSFQNAISNFRFSSSYKKKSTKVSNSSAVSVITGEKAMNGVQKLSIKQLAKSGYMTGATLKKADGTAVEGETTLADLRLKDSAGNEISGLTSLTATGGSFSVTVGDKVTNIEVKADTTVNSIIGKLKDAGVDANFDEKNGRIFIASAQSGYEKDFAITANNAEGFTALSVLGINESLGTSTDTKENPNAKTLDTYAKFASYNAQLSGLQKDKAVEVTKTRQVEKDVLDEDGNPVLDEEGNVKKELVDEEYTETEYVLNTDGFMEGLSVDSDLYKAIKAEMTEDELKDENYDAAIQRLKDKAAFAVEVTNGAGTYTEDLYSSDAVRIAGQDAEIILNDVTYTSSSNSVEVNGLTFNCLAEVDDIVITTEEDTDGIYDMIKGLFKQYNEIINEMDKLYNADSASKFQPLTEEEKDEMSEKEIEKWEQKIKDSILRRDSSIGSISQALKQGMMAGYEVGEGENKKMMYLSNFGIETLSFFLAADNEKNALHIAGDPDDAAVSSEADKLKSMIANDPDSVVSFFTQMARDMYKKMTDLSSATDYQSYGSFFEDKKYKTDLTDFDAKIKEAEDKLAKYEDKYYAKFSAMEVALSKLESSTSSITSLLGGN